MARSKGGGISIDITVNWLGDSLSSALLAFSVIWLACTLVQSFQAVAVSILPQNISRRDIFITLCIGCGFLTVSYGLHVGLIIIENSDSPLSGDIFSWVGFYVAQWTCYILAKNLILAGILRTTYNRAALYGAGQENFWMFKKIVDALFLVVITVALMISELGVYASALISDSYNIPAFSQAVDNANHLNIAGTTFYILIYISIVVGIVIIHLRAKAAPTADEVTTTLVIGICPAIVTRALFELISTILVNSSDSYTFYWGSYTLAQTIIDGLTLFTIIGILLRLGYKTAPWSVQTNNVMAAHNELGGWKPATYPSPTLPYQGVHQVSPQYPQQIYYSTPYQQGPSQQTPYPQPPYQQPPYQQPPYQQPPHQPSLSQPLNHQEVPHPTVAHLQSLQTGENYSPPATSQN